MGNAIKRHYDALQGDSSADLYLLCDVLQHYIRVACKHASRPINPYPAHIPLPRSLYRPITDEAELAQTVKKMYLPNDIFNATASSSSFSASRSGSRSGSRESSPVRKKSRGSETSDGKKRTSKSSKR